MKKTITIILAALSIGAGSLKAQLSSRSSRDAFGNINTYYSNGVSSRSSVDVFGNRNTYYSNGVSSRSSRDVFGNVNSYYSAPTMPRRVWKSGCFGGGY